MVNEAPARALRRCVDQREDGDPLRFQDSLEPLHRLVHRMMLSCRVFAKFIRREFAEFANYPKRCKPSLSVHTSQPACTHALSLIDNLTVEAIARLKVEAFAPAIAVEISPNTFQVWLNHAQLLEREVSTRAPKETSELFGMIYGAQMERHFGRLAGITNPKA